MVIHENRSPRGLNSYKGGGRDADSNYFEIKTVFLDKVDVLATGVSPPVLRRWAPLSTNALIV
jgi:hypothetical protein